MVVWPGRTFLHRMIDLLCCFRRNDHPIRLNKEFQLDLYWWQQFVRGWNGVSFWLFKGLGPISDVEVTSDAAGSIGFGADWGNEWFNGRCMGSSAEAVFYSIQGMIPNCYCCENLGWSLGTTQCVFSL